MKYAKKLAIYLAALATTAISMHNAAAYETDKKKWTDRKESEFFVDIGAGYSFYKPKFLHSFDYDLFVPTGRNGDEKNHQNSAIYTLAIGRKVSKDLSVKLEASHSSKFSNSFDKTSGNRHYTNYIATTEQSSSRIILGGEYDVFRPNNQLTLYVDGGVGLAMNHTNGGEIYALFTDYDHLADEQYIKTFPHLNYSPTWQIGSGLKYQLTEKLAFSLSYRYIDFGTFKSSAKFYRYQADIGSGENKGRYANDPADRLKFKLTSHNIILTARVKI